MCRVLSCRAVMTKVVVVAAVTMHPPCRQPQPSPSTGNSSAGDSANVIAFLIIVVVVSVRKMQLDNVIDVGYLYIHSICRELIRLVGRLESLRPVLQSLLHRMLLYPPAQHRLDAIRSLKDVSALPASTTPPRCHPLTKRCKCSTRQHNTASMPSAH